MKMASVKEQKRYTRAELMELFGPGDEHAAKTIRTLKEFGILKSVRSMDSEKDISAILDGDAVIIDTDPASEVYYVVTFVGILVVSGCILKCYPKYLADDSLSIEKLAQVLKVLEQYTAREQVIRMFNDTITKERFNLLAVMLFLLRDYHEFGSYTNSKEVIETNGSGEIIWDKTINETFALLAHERPHYVDFRTRRRLDDERDFFKRLHESVLTQFSRELQEADLLTLLDLPGVEVSDEALDALGDKDYLLYRIEGELGMQFNTRKQLVLRALYAYLSHHVTLGEVGGFSAYGTNNFHLVWESVCSHVIGNQLTTPLSALPLPTSLQPEYDGTSTLQSLIDKAKWTGQDEAGDFSHTADKTLIPDLVAIHEVAGRHRLVILDAKYYNIQLHRHQKLQGQPGISDVTKQYLYQQAFRKFTESHGITQIRNCFLMPTDKPKILNLGSVSLEMLSSLGLDNISIRLLPATEMFDHYLRGKRMNILRLSL
jgi:hypothetical protein